MSLSIAIARVVPMLFPGSAQTSAETLAMAKPLVDKLALLAMTADQEGMYQEFLRLIGVYNAIVSRLLSVELRSMHGSSAVSPCTTDPFALPSTPFIPSEETIQALTAEMENLIIDKELQTNPALRNQWLAVMRRLQEEVRPTSSSPLSVTSNGSPFPAEQSTKQEAEEETLDRETTCQQEFTSPAERSQTAPVTRSRSRSY